MSERSRPPVCDYEGSDYQTRFWEKGGREYEDRAEGIALRRLLPKNGKLLLELGAGAGRNTPRYQGFDRVVLLDYSHTQLKQAQDRLGISDRYVYVAADIYRLPFIDDLFDAATMIRVIHHMADAPAALKQIENVLQPGAAFILEFANKQNIKAILRFLLRRQEWNPFSPEQIEFAPLNFDFSPRTIKRYLKETGFRTQKILTVSHFRIETLKRRIPASLLAGLDSLIQWTGAFWQYSPSVFIRARKIKRDPSTVEFTLKNMDNIVSYFRCPDCRHSPLNGSPQKLECPSCHHAWNITDGIFDFRSEQ